jgi:alanyl-tRNA synthetase
MLRVRKVEHKDSGNTAFIVLPDLDLDAVFRAETHVNRLIAEGRNVKARTFDSIESARKEIPNLRANEEKISGTVRVVEIEGHDAAACAMEHAANLRECDFFLVSRVSKSGDEYEVDFVVGQKAKDLAISLSARLLRVCREFGANINTVETTAKKLRMENEAAQAMLRALASEKLDSIKPEKVGHFTLWKGVFSNLDDDQLRDFAGERIASENCVVLLVNITSKVANIVFARNENMTELDCVALFRSIVGPAGRGGGKSHFVTGVADIAAVERIIKDISDELARRDRAS